MRMKPGRVKSVSKGALRPHSGSDRKREGTEKGTLGPTRSSTKMYVKSFFSLAEPSKPMGLIWLAMGLGTMALPKLVVKTCFNADKIPQDNQNTFELVLCCFGAQAVMCGLALSVGKFDKHAYGVWGKAVLPFFLFDYMAWNKGYITDLGAIGDALGNIAFTFLSGRGAGWW